MGGREEKCRVGRGSFQGGLGDNSGFAGWKWIGLLTQTSELLCSSSLQGRANKSRGKVPVTSFLKPGGGRRRGRERFPGKHREGLEKQLHATRRDGARGVGLAPVAGPGRPLPGIAALRGGSLRGLGCSQAGLSPESKQPPQGRNTGRDLRHPVPLLHPHSQRPTTRPAPPNPNEFRIPPPAPSSTSAPPTAGRPPGSRDSPARWIPGQLRGGAGRNSSATSRLKLCCSRDGAVVTSSPSRRRGPGCDPAARAAARRALQPPAPPAPRLRAPPRGPQPDPRFPVLQRLWKLRPYPHSALGESAIGDFLLSLESKRWRWSLGAEFKGP